MERFVFDKVIDVIDHLNGWDTSTKVGTEVWLTVESAALATVCAIVCRIMRSNYHSDGWEVNVRKTRPNEVVRDLLTWNTDLSLSRMHDFVRLVIKNITTGWTMVHLKNASLAENRVNICKHMTPMGHEVRLLQAVMTLIGAESCGVSLRMTDALGVYVLEIADQKGFEKRFWKLT